MQWHLKSLVNLQRVVLLAIINSKSKGHPSITEILNEYDLRVQEHDLTLKPLSKSSLYKILKAWERKGLVEGSYVNEIPRTKTVKITTKGAQFLQRVKRTIEPILWGTNP